MRHRQPKTCRSAVVEDVKRVLFEIQSIRKGVDRFCKRVERVDVIAFRGYLGKAESRQIGRDNAIAIGETGNQFAILKRRSRETVEKQNDGGVRIAGFAIENTNAIGFDTSAMD